MLKTSLTAGLLACAMAVPAYAQTAPTAQPAANSATAGAKVQFMERIESSQFRGSDLMGRTVYNEQNENIGDIGDVIATREGQIQAVVIDVGGFLGIGASEVAVPFTALRFEGAQASEMASNQQAGSAGNQQTGSATGRSATEMAARNPSDVGTTGTAPTAGTNNVGGTNTGGANANGGTAADANANANAASDAGSSSTLPERIVLASTRQELEAAPKFDDAAARPDGQSAK